MGHVPSGLGPRNMVETKWNELLGGLAPTQARISNDLCDFEHWVCMDNGPNVIYILSLLSGTTHPLCS